MKHRKAKVNHHVLEWTFIGAAIVLGTMACSFSLPDISNLPRMGVLAVALAVSLLCYRQLKVPRTLGTVALALFVLLAAASTIWAVNKGEALYDTARWLTAACLFAMLYTLHSRHPARTVLMLSRVAGIVVLISLGVALKQLDALGGDLSWDNRYSLVSLHTHKGAFSLLMLLCTLPIVLRLRLRLGRARVIYWLLLALALGMVLFLSARTTLLALAALAVVWLLTLVPLRRSPLSSLYFLSSSRCSVPLRGATFHFPLSTLLVALLLGGLFLGGTRLFCHQPLGEAPGTAGGVLSSTTILERYALWNTTLRLVDRHPLRGVGAGNWKVCYPEVSSGDIFSVDVLDFTFVRPHNDYLKVLSEMGYIGLALILMALAAPIARAIGRTQRRRRTGRMTATALAYMAAVLVAAWVDFPFDRTELLIWCTLAVALLAASTPHRHFPLSQGFHPWLCKATPSGCMDMSLAFRFPLSALLVAVAVLSIVRMQSEKQFLLVTSANHGRMWNTMEQAAHKARTPLCTLTPIGTPWAYYEALAQEQQKKQAIETFSQALEDSPWHKQSLVDMGRLMYTVQHDADSAEVLFKKAVMVSPSFAHAHFNLVQFYLQEGKPDEALEALEAFDIERKRQRIELLVWKYLTGDQALYYQHQIPAAEQRMKETLLNAIVSRRNQ